MNKKLLSVAIAAAMVSPVAAMADTTLYGKVDNYLQSSDTASSDDWGINNNSSRLGVKVSEDLGNGITAIAQIEMLIDTSEEALSTTSAATGNRLGFVGLTGGFGTFVMGRLGSPFASSVNKADIMNVLGSDWATDAAGRDRYGETMAYVSPNMSGFSATVAMVSSQTSLSVDDDINDALILALDYNSGPLSVGFALRDGDMSAAGDDGLNEWGLGLSYDFGNFAVMAEYEDNKDTAEAWGLAATASFGNNTVLAQYGESESDAGADIAEVFALGFHHSLSKRTFAYAEYSDEDVSDTQTFVVGLSHSF
ncbi:MAG: porin [Candidatus Sedimenticola sp. 20ELBAFRAG]